MPDSKKTYQARYYAKNAKRIKARSHRWKRAHPERIRDYHLKQTFGITLDDYNRLLKKQKGVCAICKGPPNRQGSYTVDHDHKTDALRGLLCHRCNAALGLLREDPVVLKTAAAYLNAHKKGETT